MKEPKFKKSSMLSTVPGGGTALKSGTSMSSPHVAGVATLVMATGVTDPSQVRNRLTSTAYDLGDHTYQPSDLCYLSCLNGFSGCDIEFL